jgi:hypothetical protein
MNNPQKIRTYCKTCDEFTLFSQKKEKHICNTCNTAVNPDDTYKVSDVAPEKVLAQIERYKLSKEIRKKRDFNLFMLGSIVGFDSMPIPNNFDIIEDDCGYAKVLADFEAKRKADAQKELERQKEIKEIMRQCNKNGRNSLCICGSGKKAKKCCLKLT